MGAGLLVIDAKLWFGLFIASKTPKAIVQKKLNQNVAEILRRPEVKEIFLNQGIQAISFSLESLADFFKSEIKRGTLIIKNLNKLAN